MIELALLIRILRFADRVLRVMRAVAALRRRMSTSTSEAPVISLASRRPDTGSLPAPTGPLLPVLSAGAATPSDVAATGA